MAFSICLPPSRPCVFPRSRPRTACEEGNMFDELTTWWQNTTPETQAALQDGGYIVAALLGGPILGTMVARWLRARNFDAALRLPPASPPGPEADRGFTPTVVAG